MSCGRFEPTDPAPASKVQSKSEVGRGWGAVESVQLIGALGMTPSILYGRGECESVEANIDMEREQ